MLCLRYFIKVDILSVPTCVTSGVCMHQRFNILGGYRHLPSSVLRDFFRKFTIMDFNFFFFAEIGIKDFQNVTPVQLNRFEII